MYVGHLADSQPDKPAIIMAPSGDVVTFGEINTRSNQLAHLLRAEGLQIGDHYAIFMENHKRYVECEAAGERSGLYFTCINSYLTADEVAYIVNDCQAKVLITSVAKREIAGEVAKLCPNVSLFLMIDDDEGTNLTPEPFINYVAAIRDQPTTPIADENLGVAMLYSSGTTGRPKGILRDLPVSPPTSPLPLYNFLRNLWGYHPKMTYLSPAPLYHSAPQASVALALREGATSIIMERFDPELYLSLIEKYKVTHSQLVPTMFSRMLKLPEATRTKYDLSSLEVAVHAAAPCPAQVKEEMINWWGPIILEYYGATEGMGFACCTTDEWLAHRGTVGKIVMGELHVLDDDGAELPVGQSGTLWFKTATPFVYFNDESKTAESRTADGTMSTVGDVGYVDDDGFLYLTDRKTFMIISGGVNIYPQECENLLITHPKVMDAAVFGVPNVDLGEEVKAVVQLVAGIEPSPAVERELIEFCKSELASMKCPRTIDFEAELPRLPTGKLYKRVLRDRYWSDRGSRIV
jgi:long-chain acyl-CoA synthetase